MSTAVGDDIVLMFTRMLWHCADFFSKFAAYRR